MLCQYFYRQDAGDKRYGYCCRRKPEKLLMYCSYWLKQYHFVPFGSVSSGHAAHNFPCHELSYRTPGTPAQKIGSCTPITPPVSGRAFTCSGCSFVLTFLPYVLPAHRPLPGYSKVRLMLQAPPGTGLGVKLVNNKGMVRDTLVPSGGRGGCLLYTSPSPRD